MLIEVMLVPYVNKRGRRCIRNLYTYKCDECGILFERRYKFGGEPRLHFHSPECCKKSRRKDGALNKKLEATNVIKYGVERPMQSQSARDNYVITSLQNNNVTNPMKDRLISVPVIEHMHQTFKERYGVMHPLQVKEFADKAHENAKNTVFEKYGVENFANTPGSQEKARRTCLKHYGVEHVMQSPEIMQRIMMTKRLNDELHPSRRFHTKIERRIYDALIELTSVEDVMHPKWFNNHPVDFYIKSIDTWIEHDGEFWHGLSERSQTYECFRMKYERDREQDAEFERRGMKLVRIMYNDVKRLTHEGLKTFLRSTLHFESIQ